MTTKFRGALGSLLSIAAFAALAGEAAHEGVYLEAGAKMKQSSVVQHEVSTEAMEEIVVYARQAPIFGAEQLKADLLERIRSFSERLKAEIEMELKLQEPPAPQLHLASVENSLPSA